MPAPQGKPMYVALAQRRDVRKAQLEQQYTQVPGTLMRGTCYWSNDLAT